MKVLVLFMLLLVLASGCGDAAYTLQRGMFGIDCRPDHLQTNGQCMPLKK